MSRRRGFTLIETVVAVVLVSLLVLIGFPKVSSGMARNNVRSSRTMVVNMLARARAQSSIINRRTWLMLGGNRAWIIARPRLVAPVAGNNADTLGLVEDINARYGTTITGVDSIGFDPRGIGSGWTGLTGSITVAKSGYSDVIVIDGKGRVVK